MSHSTHTPGDGDLPTRPARVHDVACVEIEIDDWAAGKGWTSDGVFERAAGEPGALGAGVFTVRVGERTFTCLRVIDVDEDAGEDGILVEAYLEPGGRTVLFRRYNGRLWKLGPTRPPWDEALPEHRCLVIDGVVFVHWYDCLTDATGGG